MSVKGRLLAGLSAVLAVASLSANVSQAAAPTQGATGPAHVNLGRTALGEVLIGDKGLTLYIFTRDTNGESVCYDRCAAMWPPLLTDGAPVAGRGVKQELLGTTTRQDGKTQVTYNGMPLYYWYLDTRAGDVRGQDVNKVWYVVDANGAVNMQLVTYVGMARSPLGNVLVGPNGMTLYMFTRDTRNVSNCYDQCAVNWPPLLTDVKPQANKGVFGGLLGTTTRRDGKMQVTYNGMPLYYWHLDTGPDQWSGQAVGNVWWVVSPNGRAIARALPAYAKLSAGPTPYGDILVGNDGRTVYMFTRDADGESACYDRCATIWPPVLSDVQVFTGAGMDAGLIGTITRKDGTKQVTFNGMPLYYYWEDVAPGDLKGQNFNSVWFVLRPSGEVLRPG